LRAGFRAQVIDQIDYADGDVVLAIAELSH
jgi:hypothetical protein